MNQRGFSVVEVLLAATVFGFLATALIGAIVYGRESTANAGERVRANLIAEEGIEAVRNIHNNDYTSLVNGTYGLSTGSGVWTLAGTSDTTDTFTRQITVGDNGVNRKVISSRVTWTTGNHTRDTTLVTRLTDWSAPLTPTVTPGPTMMVYSKTTNTPFYRIWNGTTWGAEGSAMTVGGNINYIVAKSSPTRNETILGTQDSTGAIYVQIWNGTSWGNRTQVGIGPTTTRSFDIAYEKATGRAVIVYTPNTGSVDFAYQIWDGSAYLAPVAVTASPTTGVINWIELRQNPLSTSNEIAMIMLDANADVYGMRWTGSAWNNMGAATVWDATASTATRKGIDVEYEQSSGHIMFMWGDAVATDSYYRTWNGTTLSAATLLDIPAAGGISNWVQLAARANSDEIMVGIQDAGADLNTRKWSGTAWDTATQHPEHDDITENITSRNFDIIWETNPSNPGEAWLVWGDSATVSKRQWNGTAWDAATILTGSDDTSFLRLRANSAGSIFLGVYEATTSATDDIWESHITDGGITWSAKNIIWAGPTSIEPVHFRVDIATP